MQTLIQKLFELKQKSIVLLRDEAAYNYKYADLAQIQDKLSDALKELRLLIIHSTQNGYVVTGIHNVDSEEVISSSIEIGKINTTREWTDNKGIHNTEITEQDPQAVGSIITYYRRYNLLQLLDLKTEDNDGASASPRAKNNATSNETTQGATTPTKTYPKGRADEIMAQMDICEDLEQLKTLFEELLQLAKTEPQAKFYTSVKDKNKKRIGSKDIHAVANGIFN